MCIPRGPGPTEKDATLPRPANHHPIPNTPRGKVQIVLSQNMSDDISILTSHLFVIVMILACVFENDPTVQICQYEINFPPHQLKMGTVRKFKV